MSFTYQHVDDHGQNIPLPVGKVVCVGRNYLMHIKELNNDIPAEPLLFMKPASALCSLSQPVVIPRGLGPCHNELEVSVLIETPLSRASISEAEKAIWGVGLGLDLTLRDVQQKLKEQGQPWERAKAFDLSCPMSQFVSISNIEALSDLTFSLKVNDELRQQGNTGEMMTPLLKLVADISHTFSLLPGDIVMTGTPNGVAGLSISDQLKVELQGHISVDTSVV